MRQRDIPQRIQDLGPVLGYWLLSSAMTDIVLAGKVDTGMDGRYPSDDQMASTTRVTGRNGNTPGLISTGT